MGVVHHRLSLLFLTPHTLLLLQHGFLLQNAILHHCKSQKLPSHARKNSPTCAPLLSCSFLQGTSTCAVMGPSLVCRWISAPPWNTCSPCCRETTCIVMSFARGCRGSSTLPSLFLTDLGVCKAVSLRFTHSSLTVCCCAVL